MGLIGAVSEAFAVFRSFFECLPTAIQLLVIGGVGLFLIFGALALLFRG